MNTMQSTRICIMLSLLLCLNGGAHAQRSNSVYDKFIATVRNQYTYVNDLCHILFSIRHGIKQHQKKVSRLHKRIRQLNRQRELASQKMLLLLLKQKYPLLAKQAQTQEGSQEFKVYSKQIGAVDWKYWQYENAECNLQKKIEITQSKIASLNKEINLYHLITFSKKAKPSITAGKALITDGSERRYDPQE